MEDLLKIAGNIMQNFNPETDSADDFSPLADGQYTTLITEVSNRTSEKGTKSVYIKAQIISEVNKDRFIFVNFYFTEKTASRSIKQIIKMVHDLGFEELPLTAFESVETLAEALSALVGTEVLIDQATKNDFANHAITAVE